MTFRNRLRQLHRDFGYFFFGMSVIFAVSGLAVNHIDDWNPNYKLTVKTGLLSPSLSFGPPLPVQKIANSIGLRDTVTGYVRSGMHRFMIFLGTNSLEIDTLGRSYRYEQVEERWLLHAFNRLHLNELKNEWVFFSDFFALGLFFMAVSGLFLNKGRNGLKGRGGWLALVGVMVPVLFIGLYLI
ncbi:MAG TPA: hypothetical protein ENJ10_09725 [Caldithrix abyssi]|uniref:Peptidase n=1 Tax=Caldithrix abyssi TaxID=187145 RepID=A0A7V1LMZ8_CALAY|nr:hypothetical protein [Caldithrix abyssi]